MSSEQEPVPLDYRPPQPPSKRRDGGWRGLLMFLGGLFAGSLVSFVMWRLGWQRFENTIVWLAVPAVKVTAAVVLFFVPGWREAGAGILLSILVGTFIWFSTCAAKFNM